MRAATALLVLALAVVSCGGDSASDQTPEMMAAALLELITENHGFVSGPPPFTEYLIQDLTDPSAGDAAAAGNAATRRLTDAEREAIEAAISPFGRVSWIDDPSDYQTPDLTPTIAGAAILGVGEPVIESDTGVVPVSMWCGGTCGTWLTYRLDRANDTWTVTGIEGPIAVS